MLEKINWTVSAQVIGGPKISATDTLNVDAYDKIRVTIAADAVDKVVDIQPGGAGQARLVMISSSKYSKTEHATEKLTYKVNEAGSSIELDGPHLFIGKGAVALLDDAPESLSFTNTLGEEVLVDVLVGRDATP